MGIKYVAYLVTGSVALYSDALESVVNVLAATAALIAITVSAKPPDKNHQFGHHKAELFSAVLEGALIIVAALLVLAEAYQALIKPRALDQPLVGMLINFVATIINAGWAWLLIRQGDALKSPALSADGRHILADVWTSVGVLAGIALAAATGWHVLDPLLAVAVAINILWVGYGLVRRSLSGLMDEAAPAEIQTAIRDSIRAQGGGALEAHDIRTRNAGPVTFIEFHLVVPGDMTVNAAHEICDRIENQLASEIEGVEVLIHVEPDNKAKGRGTGGVVPI
jgi:cation diffusion facilitator family transporter